MENFIKVTLGKIKIEMQGSGMSKSELVFGFILSFALVVAAALIVGLHSAGDPTLLILVGRLLKAER